MVRLYAASSDLSWEPKQNQSYLQGLGLMGAVAQHLLYCCLRWECNCHRFFLSVVSNQFPGGQGKGFEGQWAVADACSVSTFAFNVSGLAIRDFGF